MKKLLVLVLFSFCLNMFSQVDYSNSWEDFFSYNNVKEITKAEGKIYALSDNAIFTYDESTKQVEKISSVQGLSGETTSTFYFSPEHNRIVIGYETGLLEVIDADGSITSSADIVSFNQTGSKRINHISGRGDILYVSTPFAIIEYNINRLEFGDTFFIGNNSSDVAIYQTTIFNDHIYAATDDGLFIAPLNGSSLIDFNNWQQQFSGIKYSTILNFNNRILATTGSSLYEVSGSSLNLIQNFSSSILSINTSVNRVGIVLREQVFLLNESLTPIQQVGASIEYNFTLNNSFLEGGQLYLATREFGILVTSLSSPSVFTEIHPDGPINNDVFSVSSHNDDLWIVYGGFASDFAPIHRNLGFTHYNGVVWKTTHYSPNLPFPDLISITIDKNNENRVFISSFGSTNDSNSVKTGGLFEIVDDEIKFFYNHLNSPLEDAEVLSPNTTSIRLRATEFDSNGNLWVANVGAVAELKKFTGSTWVNFDISGARPNKGFGIYDLKVDGNNTVWLGTRKDGIVVFNEVGNRIRNLNATSTQGSLPDQNVRSIAIDNDQRVWIGTESGLVVLHNGTTVFDVDAIDAQPVIFLENGIARRLLDEEIVTAIVVDGANNKWFGTDNGGVVYTNPSGQKTLATFNKDNSPLPSNRINHIAVNTATGKVYFATDKGMVAYDSKVSPFGESLGKVYAYPNPVRSHHTSVTIDGRNGTSLPKGTNVKIVDVAGNLVYETNVVEGQQVHGGKVVWDKRNLSGKKVASGVYIVLLSNEDNTETSTTKIAIIN